MNKFNAKKAFALDDSGVAIEFHSTAERDRFNHLRVLQKAGEISSLELQPKFEIQEKFKRGNKTILPIKYIADFQYTEKGKTVVEDVKGKPTPDYALKKKLFLAKNDDVIFREVRRNGTKWDVSEL